MGVDKTQVDPWATGTGMQDNFVGYISEPYFGVDERYNAEAVLFCATLVDEAGEPLTTLRYSVGEGWETNNEGTEISHPTKAQVNQNSRFGRFIDRLVKPKNERAPKHSSVTSPEGKENGLGIIEVLRGRGTPFQAKTFEGLGFLWQLHKMETMGKDEQGATVYKDVLLPTEYKGVYGSASKQAAAPKAVPAKAAPAPAAAAASSDGDAESQIPVALKKRLTLLALEQDLKTFLRTAGRDREVLALPDDVMGYIVDASGSGFHAQTNA